MDTSRDPAWAMQAICKADAPPRVFWRQGQLFDGAIWRWALRAQQKISELKRVSISSTMAQPPSRPAKWFPTLETRMPQRGMTGKEAHTNTQIRYFNMGKDIHLLRSNSSHHKNWLPCYKLGGFSEKEWWLLGNPSAVGRGQRGTEKSAGLWLHGVGAIHDMEAPVQWPCSLWHTTGHLLHLHWAEELRGVPDFGLGSIFLFL